MNFCNFGKVIMARSTKDLSTINWWNKENEETRPPVLSTNLSNNYRYQLYNNFMIKYPKMNIDKETFRRTIPRLQNYLYDKKNWKNFNKTGEQKVFTDHFSLTTWVQLPEHEKQKHQLQDCHPCNTVHLNFSKLHNSVNTSIENAQKHYEEGTAKLMESEIASPSNSNQKGVKVLKSIMTIVQPLVEKELNIKFPRQMAESLTLSPPITPKDARRSKDNVMRESRNKFTESLADGGNDVTTFLSSSKSFREHDRIRLGNFFESKETAKHRVSTNIQKEQTGKKKIKKHQGRFTSYQFDKDSFLAEIKSKPTGSRINWTAIAKKYNVKCNNRIPSNAGQVLSEFAKANGVNINKFNTNLRISHRDYYRRIRKAKKVIRLQNSKVSIPTPRQSTLLKQDIKQKISSGELYIGEKIAPKQVLYTNISSDGELVTKSSNIYGRKFPFDYLRKAALDDQLKMGILRHYNDEEYDNLSFEDLESRFQRIGEQVPEGNKDEIKQQLISLERTRNMKIWHDHSGILNHSYVCFTISWLYDPANYLTDDEFKQNNPSKKPINVQSIVETPKLYIFGQSSSTDIEQSSYTLTRLEDLTNLSLPIEVQTIKIFDVLRVFSGDGPARQFEIGQQRGGNYSCICGIPSIEHGNLDRCYKTENLTLDQRCGLFVTRRSIQQLTKGNLNPFHSLKKDELIDELNTRNIDTTDMTRPQLQETFSSLLHGVCRPPALMIPSPSTQTKDINLQHYEILGMEPLHDLSNVIQNIILELPTHITDKTVQKQLEDFAKKTIGDKNQIRGSDARLFLVKLSQFITNLPNQIKDNAKQIIDSLVEITNIAYSKYETRTPKQILRLYNQCFLFAINCRNVIGIPSKMSSRKFFGSHFHSITSHIAEAQRIFNIRSLVTEQEERCFGGLRRIAENNTNRQAEMVCDNTVLRFNCQQSVKEDCLSIQDSTIQKQAKLLKQKPRSRIPATTAQHRLVLVQSHLERISDFLLPGEGVWWHWEENDIVFHDGPEDIESQQPGPQLAHFRSSSLKQEQQKLENIWKTAVDLFHQDKLSLPLKKIKVFDYNGKATYVTPIIIDAASNPDLTSEPDSQEQENPTDPMTSHDIMHTAEIDEPSNVLTDMTNKIHDHDNTTMDYENIFEKRQDTEDRNTTIKEKYRSFIKVVKWSEKLRPYQNQCAVNQKLPGTDQEQHEQRPKPCKRKLFQTDMTVGSHLETSTGTRTTDVIKDIVGSTPEYESYVKYRRMSKANPSDKFIRQNYERCEAKIQIQVSKQRSHLKEHENPSLREQQLTKQSEELLKKWGIYYY